jgi:23S rRNA (adenine2503-C2)-methyltransferase
MAAAQEYFRATGRRISFEYALIAGVNDAIHQARQLALLLHGLPCHVNLIPLNPITREAHSPSLPLPSLSLRPSPRERVNDFRDELMAAGIPTTVRVRRGIDIEAGCGQLRQRQAGIATR